MDRGPVLRAWRRAVTHRDPVASRTDDAGFGLVELVVAMGVVAVIGMVLMLGMGESLAATTMARQRAVATGLLSAADAQIQAAPATALGTLQPDAPTTVVDGVAFCTSYASSASGGGSASTLYAFTVTVTWPGCGGPSSVVGTVDAGGA